MNSKLSKSHCFIRLFFSFTIWNEHSETAKKNLNLLDVLKTTNWTRNDGTVLTSIIIFLIQTKIKLPQLIDVFAFLFYFCFYVLLLLLLRFFLFTQFMILNYFRWMMLFYCQVFWDFRNCVTCRCSSNYRIHDRSFQAATSSYKIEQAFHFYAFSFKLYDSSMNHSHFQFIFFITSTHAHRIKYTYLYLHSCNSFEIPLWFIWIRMLEKRIHKTEFFLSKLAECKTIKWNENKRQWKYSIKNFYWNIWVDFDFKI